MWLTLWELQWRLGHQKPLWQPGELWARSLASGGRSGEIPDSVNITGPSSLTYRDMASSRTSQVLWGQALHTARPWSETREGAHSTCPRTATKLCQGGCAGRTLIQPSPPAVLSRVAWLTCHPAVCSETHCAPCRERGSNSFQIALRKGCCPRHQGRSGRSGTVLLKAFP